jgi:hypothetical protein
MVFIQHTNTLEARSDVVAGFPRSRVRYVSPLYL